RSQIPPAARRRTRLADARRSGQRRNQLPIVLGSATGRFPDRSRPLAAGDEVGRSLVPEGNNGGPPREGVQPPPARGTSEYGNALNLLAHPASLPRDDRR